MAEIIDPKRIPQVLRDLGFTAIGAGKRRLVVSSEGDMATGKTHFIGTMPGPVIAIVDFDRGTEGVLDRTELVGDKLVMRKTLPMPDFDEGSKTMSQAEMLMAKKAYDDFKQIVEKIIKSGQVRSLAVDNAGDAYTLAQMARFGRIATLGEVPAALWTSMQLEFESVFRVAYDHSTNLVLTHRQGTKFRGALGEKELKGYKRMGFVAQVHLGHEKKVTKTKDTHSLELGIRVLKCRQRLALENPEHPQHYHPIVFLDEEMTQSIGGTFVDIATAVFPNTNEFDWL